VIPSHADVCCCRRSSGQGLICCMSNIACMRHRPFQLPRAGWEPANPKQKALLYPRFSGEAGLSLLKLKGTMKSGRQQFNIWTRTISHCQLPADLCSAHSPSTSMLATENQLPLGSADSCLGTTKTGLLMVRTSLTCLEPGDSQCKCEDAHVPCSVQSPGCRPATQRR